jgi:hypothetical protein
VTQRVAPAALLALSAVALPACGGTSDRVDRQDLEGKIAAFVHQRTGAEVSVSCPDGVHARAGARVRCSTVLSGAPMVVDLQFAQAGHFRITRMRPQ